MSKCSFQIVICYQGLLKKANMDMYMLNLLSFIGCSVGQHYMNYKNLIFSNTHAQPSTFRSCHKSAMVVC